ncbi:hypothetical protein BVI1335_70084 [Burkholderia vietnamiensis]|nr:hypothetical protein BVI1335_70084 [Burkholderia vietnamiensis]
MLKITINSYDESNDVFSCECDDSQAGTNYPIELPACVLPYIARETCDACECLPFDLIGKAFTLKHQ